MQLHFPADKTFDVPEGIYGATLDEVCEQNKPTKEGISQYVWFVFRIDTLCTPTKSFMAGKNYVPSLAEHSELRLMLGAWLGEAVIQERQEHRDWELKTLEGQKADLVIRHIKNKGHKKPYVMIEQILPPGTLIPIPQDSTEEQPQAEAA